MSNSAERLADDRSNDRKPVFEMVGIAKRFGATQALAGVDMTLGAGEFVALLGPNGAGKSTLIKVLDGVVTPDTGTVRIAQEAGALGVVHQDLGLVETMTVTENLFLGLSQGWLRPGREASQAREALAMVGLSDLDPHELVESLTLGQRAMVAVAKVMHRGARIVVVDEVTAGLHPVEARWLVERLRDAAHLGATVLMVTHKLREVMGVADRFVVLVDGRVALQEDASTVTLARLIDVMSVGRNRAPATPLPNTTDAPAPATTEVVCTLRGARSTRVGPIDLELAAGRIVGLTGQVGSGLHDIGYLVAGRVRPVAGEVVVAPGTRRSCVPAHRESEGMFPEESEEFNLTAGTWRTWRRRTGLIDVTAMRRDCAATADELSLVPRNLETIVGQLSGGNQQKTILGRALIDQPDLLVLCEPTRGVDVATRREIYAQVRAAATAGTAVLIASTDLEDLLALTDLVGLVGPTGVIDRWVTGTDVAGLATSLI